MAARDTLGDTLGCSAPDWTLCVLRGLMERGP